MASITRRLLLQSRQSPSRIRVNTPTTQWQRPFNTTAVRCAKEPTKEGSATAKDAKAPAERLDDMNTAAQQETPEKAADWRSMSPSAMESAMLASLHEQLSALDPEVVKDAIRKGKHGMPILPGFDLEKDEDFAVERDDRRKVAMGFWGEGEEEEKDMEDDIGPDEDYYGDDITSHGHGELQQHRDLRHYARLIAWELPLLNQLARPFEPPSSTTPFRFRYTSYLGESHPATNKVVVEFSPPDLGLTQPQISKLIKLAGPRYNPSTEIIKLSCESFDTQAQNKRFLGETIQGLLTEVKEGKDSFEDIPFDFRHAKVKKRHEFPQEWILTPERKQYLENKRKQMAHLEDEKLHNGLLVDGKTVIDTSLPFLEQKEAATVTVRGPRRR